MKQHMSGEEDLDRLFAAYRTACPEVELGANFMPEVWARIDARRAFLPSFEHLARFVMALCAVACVVLGLLNYHSGASSEQSYAEAIATDQNTELTYHAELVRASDGGWDSSR